MSKRTQYSYKVTLHWRDGTTESGKGWGATKEEAVADYANNVGYSGGAFRALDYWEAVREEV